MRRIITLGLLLVGMRLVLPLGERGHGSQTLLTFGFLILAAYTVGEVADRWHLPRIMGYVAAGLLFGPTSLGTVTTEGARELAPVASLAIALIAFLAGAELRWSEVQQHGIAALKVVSVELGLTFVCVTATLVALQPHISFLAALPLPSALALSVLFATVAVVHSPAVTVALLTETRAKGPVARTTLQVVLISDIIVILLFSVALSFARVLAPPTGADVTAPSVGTLLWEIVGAVVIGSAYGAAVAVYLVSVRRQLFLFALLVAFLGSELARLTHVEPLLMLLVAGFVTENSSHSEDATLLREAMERSAAPVFVIFFALAGSAVVLDGALGVWPMFIVLVCVRAAAIWAGTHVGARWARLSAPEVRYVWMGLISQAGVAVGLAEIAARVYPSRGVQLRDLALLTLAINQLIGPALFRLALARSGELPVPDRGGAPVQSGSQTEAMI